MSAAELRPIPGWEQRYSVSADGNVFSLVGPGGHVRSQPHRLSPRVRPDGYLAVGLYDNGRTRHVAVHIVVLEAFVGPRPSRRHEASHLNGKRADCRLENLEWELARDNLARRHEHGTMVLGERHHLHRLTADAVQAVRAALRAGFSVKQIARDHNVGETTIRNIISGRTWRHVSETC